MKVRPLTEQDIEAGLVLSMQASWNHAAADWRRLITLWPGQCLGAEIGGRLVASGTLATYQSTRGRIGWVGLILVDQNHRRQGLGTRMMHAILNLANERGVATVGLDASDQGEPIYHKLGFVVDASINRWAGRGAIGEMGPIDDADWPELLQADRQACGGVDREPLLRQLCAESQTRVAPAPDCGAFAILRPGRRSWHLGPVIARDAHAAALLVVGLIGDASSPSTTDIIVDVIAGSPMESILAQRGFAITRRLKRMRYPAASGGKLLWGPHVYAATGFELG
jgi:GNAT superfamily N-acetyltransferase